MKAFIDTNIFVYATYPSFVQNVAATAFLKKCLAGHDPLFLSWGVIYEYLSVATNPRLFIGDTLPFDRAVENMLQVTAAPNVEVLSESADHFPLLKDLQREGNTLQGRLLHDAHSVVLMRENDIKTIYTCDTDFNRFKGIEVLNPLL